MTLPVKARDLRNNINVYGFERGIEVTLVLLLDEFVSLRQSMADMAKLQSDLIDRCLEIASAAETMGKRITDLKRVEDQFNEQRGAGIIPTDDC